MKNQRHFGILDGTSQLEAERIGTLINDLDRIVQLLNCDIETEEEHAGVSDRSNAAYPILARTLAARRDNLRETMAALERRLAAIKTPLGNAVAA
jgi:septation ring formation regulator EzrA